jgi:hypothetical protein
MKFKNFSLLLGSILIFALLAVFTCAQSGNPAQQDLVKKMVLQEGMTRDMKVLEGLATEITKDNDELAGDFESRDFIAMAKIYKKRGGVIVSPDYERIAGSESAEFWQQVWEKGAKAEIKPVSIYLTNVIGKKLIKSLVGDSIGEKTYDTVAFVIHEFHIVQKTEGETAHNLSVAACMVYRHQTDCHWEEIIK